MPYQNTLFGLPKCVFNHVSFFLDSLILSLSSEFQDNINGRLYYAACALSNMVNGKYTTRKFYVQLRSMKNKW